MSTMPVIRVYRHPLSGHAHRVELFLSLLGLPYEPVDVDLRRGEHKTPEFLARNPFGQVPVLEDGDVTLADSNAILVYLAGRYDSSGRWYPRDPLTAGRIQQWLSVAAGQLAYGPAAARRFKLLGAPLDYEQARARRRRSSSLCSIGTWPHDRSSWATRPRSPTSPCTPTPPSRPRAASRSSPTGTFGAGSPASKRCPGSCR